MSLFFFFNDTATTEIYTLSLHDALPISPAHRAAAPDHARSGGPPPKSRRRCRRRDRKSTRLNSSHVEISYAVFCLKKKKTLKESLEIAGTDDAHIYAHDNKTDHNLALLH